MSKGQMSSANDYAHIEALYKQAESHQYNNFVEALKLLEEGYEELSVNGPDNSNPQYRKLITAFLRKLSFIHFQSANYKESKYYAGLLYDTSILFDDVESKADAYTSFGNIFSDTGNFREAFKYNTKALDMHTLADNVGGMAVSYNNLGNILKYEDNNADALEYFQKALDIFNTEDLRMHKSSVLQNIATVYIQQKRYDEALNVLNKSLELKKEFNDLRGTAYGTHLIGEVFLGKGSYECAVANFEKAIEMQKHLDDKISLMICYPLLAKALMQIFLKSGDMKNPRLKTDAERYFTEAMNLAIAAESKANLSNIYKDFSEFYEQINDYKMAHTHLKNYCDTAKEVFHKNLAEEIMKYKKDIELKEANHIAEVNQIRNVELAETVAKLEELNKQKNEFFGIVVHDLKNPIGNIKHLAEFLNSDEDFSSEERTEFQTHIIEIADTSMNLLTKLLDEAAIEMGNIVLEITDVNINYEITRLLKLYKKQTSAKKLNIVFKNNLKCDIIRTDKNAIVHIFDNIFSNAIKFSPHEKSIYIKLVCEDDFLFLSVKDEGPGFTEADKLKLFTEFSKLSAKPTAGEHSSGLGLSIVKKLAESLNGTVEYESETGKGLNMTVKIPVG